eukprot:jgi/Psemu1/302057/fgenesh1_kg.56_\
MSSRQCRKDYSIYPEDLLKEEFHRTTNPISPNFAPMKLYKRCRIEEIAREKFGSLEKAHEMIEFRRRQRREIRNRNYKAARAFHMNLRSPRSLSIVDHHEEEFATPAQLRYLIYLGAEPVAGLSKKSASMAISKMKEKC